MQVFSEVSPILLSGTYSLVGMHKIVPLVDVPLFGKKVLCSLFKLRWHFAVGEMCQVSERISSLFSSYLPPALGSLI